MKPISRQVSPLRAWIQANPNIAKFAKAMNVTEVTAHSWCGQHGVPEHRIADVKAYTGLTRQQLFRENAPRKKQQKPAPLTWGGCWTE